MMKRKISVLLTSVAIAALAQAQDDNAAQEAAAQAPADSVALTVPQVKPGECQPPSPTRLFPLNTSGRKSRS